MSKNFQLFLLSAALVSLFSLGVNATQKNITDLEGILTAQILQPVQEISVLEIPEKNQKPNLELAVKSAISIKIDGNGSKKVVFEQNPNQLLPIASLSKLMAAIVVLEDNQDYDLSKNVSISKVAVLQDESLGNLKEGDELSVKELLYTMLIESSNDAAWALAEVAGPRYFVEMMNLKSKDLGILGTHFINPTGLDPVELPASLSNFNFSNTKDLAEIGEYILTSHPEIWEISSKLSYEVLDSSGKFHHLAVNKNGFLHISPNFETIGWKTGYTDNAGGCVILILKDAKGNFYINIVLGAASADARLEEMKKLVDWLAL